jgi:cbb3-type cytochrome oxidase subunit 1
MFGFLSTGMIGLWYYIIPRLTGRRLWSEPLANLVLALWTVGVLLISTAHTQSREYAEMVWGVKVAILVALAINLVIVFMTIARRVESKLYVTLWFIIGMAMWMPLLYAIGNVVWNPPTNALTGVNDAIWNWFYGHNVLGL